jgi:hypothetical protein
VSTAGKNNATNETYTQVSDKYMISLMGNYNVGRIEKAVLGKFECERSELIG